MNLCLHLLLHVAELLVRVGELEEVDVVVEEVEVVGRRRQPLLLLLRRTEMEMMMNPLPHPALGVEVVGADVDADVVVAAFHDSFVKVMMPMMRRGRSP